MGFCDSMDKDTEDDADIKCLGDIDHIATPSGANQHQVKEVTAIFREKLLQRGAEDLKLLKENYQKHIQTLSEQLIILLQERLEMKEEVDMRKISLEQFIRIHQFSPYDIETILGSHCMKQPTEENCVTEQTCYEYVLQLSHTECSNKTSPGLTTLAQIHNTNTDDVIYTDHVHQGNTNSDDVIHRDHAHQGNTNSDDVIHRTQTHQEFPSPGNSQYFSRNRCRSVSVTRLCDNDVFKMDKRTKRYSLRELPCSVTDRTFFQTQIT